MKAKRVRVLIVTAVIGTCAIGTQQAHAGCTQDLAKKVVASGGSGTAGHTTAYVRCVV